MAEEMPMADRIRANAELVVSVAGDELKQEIGYDETGVRWLDGYIQRQHEQGDPNNRDGPWWATRATTRAARRTARRWA